MKLIYDLWLAKLRTADADCSPSPAENGELFPPFEPDAEPVGGMVRYVAPGGTGSGASWDDASGDLQNMIAASSSGDRIYVMAGEYPLTANIIPKVGVSIYGGFDADTRNWSGRQPFQHASIFNPDYQDVKLVNPVNFAEGQVIDGLTIVNVYSNITNGTAFVNNVTANKMYLKHCVARNCASTWANRNAGAFYYAESANCLAVGCRSKNNGAAAFHYGSCRQCYAVDCRGGSGSFSYSANSDCLALNYFGRSSAYYNGISTRCRAVKCVGENGGGFNGGTVSDCIAIECTAAIYGGGFYRTGNEVFNNCIAIDCMTLSGSNGYGGGFYGNATGCLALNCFSSGRGSGFATGNFINCIAENCSFSDTYYTSGNVINSMAINCTTGTTFYLNGGGTTSVFCNNIAINCWSAMGAPQIASAVFINTGTRKIYNCFLQGTVQCNTGAAADKRNTIEFGLNGAYIIDDCKFSDNGTYPIIGELTFENCRQKWEDGVFGDFNLAGDNILAKAGYWEDGVTPAVDYAGRERGAGNISIGPFEPGGLKTMRDNGGLALLARSRHADEFGNETSGDFPPVEIESIEPQEE